MHLGIKRDVSGKVNVEEKVSLGHRTACSLMGAGFHSVNGLKSSQNAHIWSTFVVHRIVYGLEAVLLSHKEFECLEKFQRQSLRQIQGLPDKTPNGITLALLGILLLETVIHKNALNLFMSIARNCDTMEYDITMRQLVMKKECEKSWFNYIKNLLDLYCLPSVFELFNAPPSKSEWKDLLNKSVNSVIEKKWRNEIEQKSSLKYVNPEVIKVSKCHPIWSTVRNSVNDSRRAQLKCKLLTGTYILQANRAVFNQYQVDPTCKLCSAAPETRQHFVAECSVFEIERNIFKQRMANYTASFIDQQDPDTFTRLVLEPSEMVKPTVADECGLTQVELCTREYIHEIHKKESPN